MQVNDNTKPNLDADSSEQPIADYFFLRKKGIQYLEQLTGSIWSDFNAHDPGITILEQLCYALSDLSYRSAYELPDLLCQQGEDAYTSLYKPTEILPIAPLTLSDLRKYLIDLSGVG